MKISAPKYFSDFKCISSQCRHNCCIGWEIGIDSETLSRYASDGAVGYAAKIKSTLRHGGSECSFRLTEGGRCPHLDESGLCRIISSLGEEWLSDICREHPRFYNNVGDRMEVGLGACCEEAARLILSCENYRQEVHVGETEGETKAAALGRTEREKIYSILSDGGLPYSERLDRISSGWQVTAEVLSDGEWRRVFSELEYLDVSDRELFSLYRSDASAEGREAAERFLAYLIYRHVSPCESIEALRPALGFCLLLERLFLSLTDGVKALPPYEAARIISAELEYSEDNTEALMTELEFSLI